jgi:hypothetical protein
MVRLHFESNFVVVRSAKREDSPVWSVLVFNLPSMTESRRFQFQKIRDVIDQQIAFSPGIHAGRDNGDYVEPGKNSNLLVFKFDIHVIRVHDVRFLGGGVSIFWWLLRGVKILMAAGHG